jgi:hypothetical protein
VLRQPSKEKNRQGIWRVQHWRAELMSSQPAAQASIPGTRTSLCTRTSGERARQGGVGTSRTGEGPSASDTMHRGGASYL